MKLRAVGVILALCAIAFTMPSRAAAWVYGPIVGIGSKCLDNYAARAVDGNTIQLYQCNGGAAQNWVFPGDGTIRNQGYCLDVKRSGSTSETPVWLYHCNGTAAQQWVVHTDGTITNPIANLCLDDKWGVARDGNPIWVYTCNGSVAQKWKVPGTVAPPPPPPVDTTPPTTPANLTAAAASPTRVNLSWSISTDNVGVSKYLVHRDGVALASTTATTYVDTTVTANTRYAYQVRAVDAANNASALSAVAAVTTPAPPDTLAPTAPTALSATAASATRINLSWSASSDNVGVAKYRVYRNGSATALAEPSGTSYADTTVAAGSSYSYQVRAVDAAGNASGLSNTAAINTPPPPDTVAPSVPGGLAARATTPTRVELSWTSSTDNVRVTKYRVYRNGSASALAELVGTSYADTSVMAHTAYSYQVSAVDAAGNASALSNKVALTTPANNSPSGEPMPVGDLSGWHMIFSDDFTTDVPLGSFPAAVSSRWSAYLDGWKDTSRRGTYMPSKVVSIHDGLMDLYLHTEGGVHMVSAPVPKLPGIANGQLYGRYAIRFKADSVACHKTAWLLWPDSEVWPRDGEVDFPEGGLDGNMNAFMHRQNGTSGGDQDAFSTSAKYTSWHTAVIEWSPGLMTFILDGAVIGTSTSRVPNTPMHWVIQTETSLDCEPTDAMSGHVLIDWVAVYSR